MPQNVNVQTQTVLFGLYAQSGMKQHGEHSALLVRRKTQNQKHKTRKDGVRQGV